MRATVSVDRLKIDKALYDFVNDEAIAGSGVQAREFWGGFAALVRALAPRNAALLRRRDDLQISTAALGEISGIHRNRLSHYFSGTAQIPKAEIVQLEKIFNELDELVRLADPFPVAFQNAAKIKDLLARLRAGELNDKIKKEKQNAEGVST